MQYCLITFTIAAVSLWAQAPTLQDRTDSQPPKANVSEVSGEKTFKVPAGTHLLLSVLSATSSRNAQPGDWVYLETTFPIAGNGRVIIPAGSYVTGTITGATPSGKVKGKGELLLRIDTLMLANGVTRGVHGPVAGLDGNNQARIKKEGDGLTAEGSPDAQTIAMTAEQVGMTGAVMSFNSGTARGIYGAGLGAAVALGNVLMARGPDAKLSQGSKIQMVLDTDLTYLESELGPAQPAQFRPSAAVPPPAIDPDNQRNQTLRPGFGMPGVGRFPTIP